MRDETIAAIATSLGEGGIGIVRISGDEALNILEKIFDYFNKDLKNKTVDKSVDKLDNLSKDSMSRKAEIQANKLIYGHIYDNFTGELIDEVMAVYMKGPHSYTAEDVVEIQCHGSIVSLKKILSLVLKNGARLAENGEFTKRAFLNGRLDLSQAEAVIDLIRAKSDRTFTVALGQLEGKLSKKIKDIRGKLVDILVNITVNIDYPDEDIEEITYDKLLKDLEAVKFSIDSLRESFQTGRILKEGLRVSIIGKPNVGKSSLMNALLKEERAIVTDIPGTTRDTIEESLSVRGIPIIITDTAGIRETDDVIEKIGIEKSKEAFNSADLIIFILDNSKTLEEADFDIIEKIQGRNALVLVNKTDLERVIDLKEIEKRLPKAEILEVAISKEVGIKELEEKIEALVYGCKVKAGEGLMVTNVRHKEILDLAGEAVADSLVMVQSGEALEFLEIDVNRAYELLGSIVGETVEGDIIDQVFARFCLGK